VPRPEGVAEQTWADFVQLRKDLKAPITQTALDGIVREATKAGWKPEEAIAECCTRGWRGFKAEWVRGAARPGRGAAAAPRGSDTTAEAMRMLGIADGGDVIDMEDC
jgi:hypothetical protein